MRFDCFSAATAALALVVGLGPGNAAAAVHVEGDLPRQGVLGFTPGGAEGSLVVQDLDPASPAAGAGLAEGDVILSVNGDAYAHAYVGRALLEKLDADVPATLAVRRDGATRTVTFVPEPRPLEAIPGLDSYYGVVDTADGSRLRTIVTKPEGVSGPLPAIFFTQWVSCGSLEYDPDSTSRSILATVAQKTGLALIRVERTTSGDSEGPACHELDYDTELQHYFEAWQALARGPHIDADNLIIMGSSLGSTVAPLLANRILEAGGNVMGMVVSGGGAVTYLERMINFDRLYLERRPDADPRRIHQEMIHRIRFQYEYLVKDRDPDDIAQDSPEMAAVRADTRGLGDGQQYGRPYAWHQQAAKHDFLSAWLDIVAPVLVTFNEYDQFEMRHGHRIIVDMVNRYRPGTATFLEQKSIGHSNYIYPDAEAAYANADGLSVPIVYASRVSQWITEIVVPTFE